MKTINHRTSASPSLSSSLASSPSSSTSSSTSALCSKLPFYRTAILLFLIGVFNLNGLFGQELIKFNENWLYGYKDKTTGKKIIPAKFSYAEDFKGKLAIVSEDKIAGPATVMNYKIINTKGEYISDISFTEGTNIGSGLVKISKLTGGETQLANGKIYFGSAPHGIINSAGKLLFPPVLEEIGEISEGLIVIARKDSSGVIDITGKFVIPFQTQYTGTANTKT